jgi:hypothetical protein
MGYIGIPGGMLNRFIKECAWNPGDKVPPHEDPYLADDYKGYSTHSIHECYNTDTQIVLMNWLYDKRRKYKLEYRGDDPFWIFHDHQHSQHDVYGYEVNGIYSYIEQQRLLQGADMAKDFGYFIKPKTAAEIVMAWRDRFHFAERDSMTVMTEKDFYPLLQDNSAREEMSQIIEYGISDYR